MFILNNTLSIQSILDAQNQLVDAVNTADTRLEITGAIKCFEYCYELSWKLMQKILKHQGASDVNSPRAVFALANKNGLIDDLNAWISFIEKRNMTVHTYDGELANFVFESLPFFLEHLSLFIDRVKGL